ncbi:MAG: hypothetical protein H3C47_16925 [Candidatus Cloacimonetes bacterium]|nr:hypothetical protein [Candidatus Cloacimonadota bacterium]
MVLPLPDFLTKQLFDPLGEHEFWQNIYGKTWHAFLQNPENPKRFEPDFSHASFLKLLQVPSTWSQNSVKLVVNGTVLPARQYCRPMEYRRDPNVMVPDWKTVEEILLKGATLVLNAVDLWHEFSNHLSSYLEELSLCRAQANLYWTEGSYRGFDLHYDAHDVIVLQLSGRKIWKIYSGTNKNPDEPVPPAPISKMKAGEYFDTVDLKAGDVLYIPAGRYHEATVYENHSIHLSFALKLLRPKDIMAALFAQLAEKPFVNEVLYLKPDAEKALSDSLSRLQTELQALTQDPALLKGILNRAREAARQRQGLNWRHLD